MSSEDKVLHLHEIFFSLIKNSTTGGQLAGSPRGRAHCMNSLGHMAWLSFRCFLGARNDSSH
jgi:hypothetical protein